MSNPTHPVITFSVNLDLNQSEPFGPKTNLSTVAILHPDMHDTSADRGRTNKGYHKDQITTFIPGILCGENVVKNDDGTFTAYGQKATYIKNTYTTGTNPLLSVVE